MIRQGYAVTHDEHTLPEAKIVDVFGNVVTDLTIEERREAVRACKSMPLRSEVFALDAPLVGATPDEIKNNSPHIP